VLVIEDDPGVRELLEMLLTDQGHFTIGAQDGPSALELVASGTIRPDLIVADYNLPGGINGLVATDRLRRKLGRTIPAIILTGDISSETLRDIGLGDCTRLNKPVKPRELTQLIQRLLSVPRSAPAALPPIPPPLAMAAPTIFVVDDDSQLRGAMQLLFQAEGMRVELYPSCEAFLETWRPGNGGCLLLDAYLPGMTGLELLRLLHSKDPRFSAIMITGNGDVEMAVEAMKAGALDFIEKPAGGRELLTRVRQMLENSRDSTSLSAWRTAAVNHLAGLTSRQHQIMTMVLAGMANKNIAADLGISQRTVEGHRAAIMKKTGSKSLPALARLALVAARDGEPQ